MAAGCAELGHGRLGLVVEGGPGDRDWNLERERGCAVAWWFFGSEEGDAVGAYGSASAKGLPPSVIGCCCQARSTIPRGSIRPSSSALDLLA